MKTLFAAVLIFLGTSAAYADHLVCNNDQEQATEVGFYNNWGKIIFQLSAPHNDDYLYILGICYSDNSTGMGLPYTCEVAPGQDEDVTVKLIEDDDGRAIADLSFRFKDGTSHNELIACEYYQ